MVFRKILIPLDGSELSERILAQVRRLLVRQDAEVLLLHVVGAQEAGGAAEEQQLQAVEASRSYLERLVQDLNGDGATAHARVARGDPAERVLEVATEVGSDLIALATHGRTGLDRWVRGSVAERLLRRSPAPLLLANPHGVARGGGEARFRKILVPLDGSELAARILPSVRELALLYGAQVVLLRVEWIVPATAHYPLAETMPLRTADEVAATLAPFREALVAGGVEVSAQVEFGVEAERILHVAETQGVDLVAMTTHGRSGLSRWMFGSVAENVLRHCTCPVLVQRVAAG